MVKQYLLDTNIICIYFLKGQFNLHYKIEKVGIESCFISEITVAELKYGVEKSTHKEKNKEILNQFLAQFTVLPILSALDIYTKEKARLKTQGNLLDDFDLLIGASAIANRLILVTRNVSDFERLEGINIEEWTQE